jgi:ABC-2 type transport system ATP-binding protein
VPGLDVDDLHVRYGEVLALDGMTLAVAPGQLLGFLGPNGAGKTTTMRAVLGLVRADAGEVRWNGQPIDHATRRSIGYMPEARGLYPRMKVHEQVTYFGRLAGLDAKVARAAAATWLERLDLGDRLTSQVQDLSHGNQQRVQLAVALVHDPALLVLDEPFSGLDPLAVTTMSGIITERASAGAAVLFSSHQLDLVEGLCDDVVIVRGGRTVAAGRVDALRAASPRRVLRIELDEPASTGSTAWPPRLVDAEVRQVDASRYVATVRHDLALDAVVRSVAQAHRIRSFSFTPPRLSDVFVEAVG